MSPMKRKIDVSKQRGPGRPPAGSVDQRELLLDAALDRFSQEGIAATSLRALARQTGVTPAMLHYYFGSKDRLVEAIIAERLMPVMADLRDGLTAMAGQDAPTTIVAFVTSMHQSIQRHPWLPGLWVREVLSDSGHLRDVLVQRIAPAISLRLCERVASAQADDELSPELDPRLLFVSLIGLTLFPFAAAPIWRRVFEADDIDAEKMLAHTIALLERGIGVQHET